MFSPIFPIYPKLDSTRIGLQARSGRLVERSPESTPPLLARWNRTSRLLVGRLETVQVPGWRW